MALKSTSFHLIFLATEFELKAIFISNQVDDEDEWAASMGDKQDDSLVEQDPSEKVLNWLDKADNEDETAVAEDTNAEMTNAFGELKLDQFT